MLLCAILLPMPRANAGMNSLNCDYKGFECDYQQQANISLRRTSPELALPGVQRPWVAMIRVPTARMDPFDSLPIKMPLKSQELFTYRKCCTQT